MCGALGAPDAGLQTDRSVPSRQLVSEPVELAIDARDRVVVADARTPIRDAGADLRELPLVTRDPRRCPAEADQRGHEIVGRSREHRIQDNGAKTGAVVERQKAWFADKVVDAIDFASVRH